MPHSIALITDSTCDIPAEWRQQYDITVVPLSITFGDQTYLDGVDMPAEDFYARLGKDPHFPISSQPPASAFLEAYQRAYEKGASRVLAFTISSGMSGTIGSARSAAQESPIPVEVVDSKSNSMGLGWQVITAARVRESGGTLEQMVAAADRARDRMTYFITLDTMEYLSKGGRIADAVRLLNGVLQIKPLIYVRHETGTVGASIPSRSRKAAVDSLYKEFFKRMDPTHPMHITVLHNAVPEEAEALAERVRQEYHPAELFVHIVSPVLGVHTGPKALALCGYSE